MKAYLATCFALMTVCFCATGTQARTAMEDLKTAPTKNNPVFFAVPDNFDATKPVRVVVYFHGNLYDESFEHVLERQQIAQQVTNADINAVLIAPYFGDSVAQSTGTFADEDGFKKFMHSALTYVVAFAQVPVSALERAPTALIVYSGGFGPAKALFENNVDVDSVLLMDAHYGSQEAFVAEAIVIAQRKRGVFMSAYSQDTDYRAEQFKAQFKETGLRLEITVPDVFMPGMVIQTFVPGKDMHFDFVTNAWTENPITDFLKKTYTARP